MFSKISRYRKLPDIVTTDAKGRVLKSKSLRLLPWVSGDFFHTAEEVDRLDHLAYKYYKQPRKWWRICDANPGFMSPIALLGKEPIVTYRFPLNYKGNGGQPPWDKLLKGLSENLGVCEVKIVEEVSLVPEKQILDGEPVVIDGEPVVIYRERPEQAVIVTFNQMNITPIDLANIIADPGFEVGKPEKIDRVGKSIIIPRNIVG